MQFARIGKWAAIAMAMALGWALLYGSRMPAQVEVTRTIIVKAPPRAIYPLLSDFRNGWTQWNTFDDEDPGIAFTYAGPERGVGSIQKWTSRKVGDGQMTLTRADSLGGVDFRMEMGPGGKDFSRTGSLAMSPVDGGTLLTWTDRADLGSGATKRLMGPILARMMGKAFENSLAGIKRLSEAAPAPTAALHADSASATGSPASRK